MIISQLIDCLIDIKVKLSDPDKRDFHALTKNLRVLNLSCDECGNVESTFDNSGAWRDENCRHENTEYQPAESDTNIPESYTCEDCGIDMPLPEPAEDSLKPDGEDR